MKVDVAVAGVAFGTRYRDAFTGFEGVAESVCMNHDGEVQIALAYNDGTVPKTVWVKASRLGSIGERTRPGIAT